MDDPKPSLSWPACLRWTLASSVVLVVAVGVFNVLIDPLGVFDTPKVASLNAIKPHLDHHRELARWTAARRLCPDTAIFGNSRAEIGFDPQSPLLVERGLVAFNHAIPGTGVGLSYRQMAWLEAAGCAPKTIFLGVEFFDFLGAGRARPGSLESSPPPRLDAGFFAESVFSITGLRDSAGTILLQRARYPATLTDRGFNPLLNYLADVEQSGHYALFRQRADENARNWARKPRRVRLVEGEMSDDEQAVDAIVARARQAGSQVHLIIYPYHAQTRLIIERLGLGDAFDEWKRLIVGVAARQAVKGAKVQVWDFSGVSPQILEAIPARGDRTHMKYYWEAGHFKKELGDLMIGRMLGRLAEFGVELDAGNVERLLVEDRSAVLTLLATRSPMLTEVDQIVGGIVKGSVGPPQHHSP